MKPWLRGTWTSEKSPIFTLVSAYFGARTVHHARPRASTFVNPGSVGLSYDHALVEEVVRFDPWAAWAIVDVDDDLVSVEFRRARYDREQVVAAIEASTMPDKRRIDGWRA